jgi:polyisoprenoid-binding protein YceI
MKLIVLLLLVSSSIFAQCKFDSKTSNLTWTGFKLAKKAGVSGSFDKYTITSKEGKSVRDVIKSASFDIDASTVNSKNKPRDIKLAKFVFSTLEDGPKITGKVLSYTTKKALVQIMMNKITKNVIMKHTQNNSRHILNANIDMLDFAMKDEHAAIAKACTAKHKGKTWTDVDIKIEFDINCVKAIKTKN